MVKALRLQGFSYFDCMQVKAMVFYEQWKAVVGWVDMYLNALTDEELKTELTPGGNHGIWLLGHLIASDDDLSLYLGKGNLLYPEYQKLFAQGSKLLPPSEYPPAKELREHWKAVCVKNAALYESLTDEDLNQLHEMIKGDKEKDYFKTKQRCIIHWQLHQVHHAGQLAVLLAKRGKPRLI